MDHRAFQDDLAATGFEHCWGCGVANEHGLRLRSFWEGDEAVCHWQPQPYHIAAPGAVSGGILATLIDCHCAATAVATAYRAEGRTIGTGEPIRYVTASLEVTYLRPTPLGPLTLRARPGEVAGRKMTVSCSVYAATGEECARGTVVAARVPATWRASA